MVWVSVLGNHRAHERPQGQLPAGPTDHIQTADMLRGPRRFEDIFNHLLTFLNWDIFT